MQGIERETLREGVTAVYGEEVQGWPQRRAPATAELIEAMERVLLDAPLIHLYKNRGPGGGHPSYVAILMGGGAAVLKPARDAPAGEADGEQMVKHERAAWVLATGLGFSDLVATTVLREVPWPSDRSVTTLASLQSVWPNSDAYPAAEPLDTVDKYDALRAAIFDWIIQATDRSSNNWLTLNGTQPPQLKLIDHGHAFGHAGRGFASDPHALVKKAGEVLIPKEIVTSLKSVVDGWPPRDLPDLLTDSAAQSVKDRIVELVDAGKL